MYCFFCHPSYFFLLALFLLFFSSLLFSSLAGWGAAAKNALVGGCLLALIEGVGFFVGRATAQDQSNIPPPVELLGSRSALSTISKSASAATLQNNQRASLLLKDEQAQTLMTDFGTDDFTFDDTDDLE